MANNISRQQGRMHTHTHINKDTHTLFVSTCHIGNNSMSYLEQIRGFNCFRVFQSQSTVEVRKQSEGCMCQSVRLKLLVRGGEAGVGRGHKYQPFLDTSAFPLCHSLSHTRQTGPLPYQPHLSQCCPDFPLQLLIKTFQGRHTWSGF